MIKQRILSDKYFTEEMDAFWEELKQKTLEKGKEGKEGGCGSPGQQTLVAGRGVVTRRVVTRRHSWGGRGSPRCRGLPTPHILSFHFIGRLDCGVASPCRLGPQSSTPVIMSTNAPLGLADKVCHSYGPDESVAHPTRASPPGPPRLELPSMTSSKLGGIQKLLTMVEACGLKSLRSPAR